MPGDYVSHAPCGHGHINDTYEVRYNQAGTQVRDLLRMGEMLPPEFSRPEVAKVLVDSLAEPDHWSWGGRT